MIPECGDILSTKVEMLLRYSQRPTQKAEPYFSFKKKPMQRKRFFLLNLKSEIENNKFQSAPKTFYEQKNAF